VTSSNPALRPIVMLVDDDEDLREITSTLLTSEGYQALEARNGKEAIEVLTKARRLPRLIVLDLGMPILDGRGFLKWRKRDPIVAKIPVIVVSGSSLPFPLEGVEACLRKPVEVAGFLRLIADYR
jgi:two-component system, chemotaxis family, chemotaxis protein CheY